MLHAWLEPAFFKQELFGLVILPPAIADITHNGEGCKGEVKYPGIHSLGRSFSQLLGGLGTNRTLRNGLNTRQGKQHDE